MSGRLSNFREGDRSEYLATFLLSGIGLVTPVPRQEDIGIDFYCTLADQETGFLTFGFPFGVQVKSASQSDVVFGDLKNGRWPSHDIRWLFQRELPFFIAFVDKAKIKLDLFNTSALWFIIWESPDCSRIVLKPRADRNDNSDVGRPAKTELTEWPANSGDGYTYAVDLGQPVVSLQYSDFEDNDKLKKIKSVLRAAIYYEQRNFIYHKLRLPHFEWILRSRSNESFDAAWFYTTTNVDISDDLIVNLAPMIISLAMNWEQQGRTDDLALLRPLIALIPADMIYAELRSSFPNSFGTH